jgi:hypothetical protein
LITKFDKSEKTGQSCLTFRIVRFRQFQKRAKEGYNMKKFGVQECLRHGTGGKHNKDPIQRRLNPKVEVTKTERSALGFRMVQFFFNR